MIALAYHNAQMYESTLIKCSRRQRATWYFGHLDSFLADGGQHFGYSKNRFDAIYHNTHAFERITHAIK